MKIRCKLYVTSITQYNDPAGCGQVQMSAVFKSTPGIDGNACAENAEVLGKYTPSASFTASIQNSTAFEEFKRCLENKIPFYVDFIAEDLEKSATA